MFTGRDILKLWSQGYNKQEIARKTNLCLFYVHNILQSKKKEKMMTNSRKWYAYCIDDFGWRVGLLDGAVCFDADEAFKMAQEYARAVGLNFESIVVEERKE